MAKTTGDAASTTVSSREAAAVRLRPVVATPAAPKPSKSATVLKLLSRARGATAAELGQPTGWKPHSVRAYLTGLRKKGLTIIREKRRTGETAYRIVDAPTVAPADSAENATAPAAA